MGKGSVTSVNIMQLIAKAQQDKMNPGSNAELNENETQQEEADEAITPGTVPSVSPTAKPVGGLGY